jgi:flavin reductase (DIM6/NTAB) family NADH-FMN oxidoreductase RutF
MEVVMSVTLDFAQLTSDSRYHIMTQCVIPRPIAWVLTRSGAGVLNLAPFSFFTAVSSDPPLLMISVGHKATDRFAGELKDTARNLLEQRAAVIHIAHFDQLASVQLSAKECSADESEIELTGEEVVTQSGFELSRLKSAPIAMNCRYFSHSVIGQQHQYLIFVQIESVVVADECMPSGAPADLSRVRIDPAAVDPLARLGAGFFSRIANVTKAPVAGQKQ